MAKFRKKPVVIEAVQLLWSNWIEICSHANVGLLADGKPEGCFLDEAGQPIPDNTIANRERLGLLIPTREGVMIGVENDWIIKGIKGELYPCKPDIFEATYEKVME